MKRSFWIGLAFAMAGVLIAGSARTWEARARQAKDEVSRMTNKMKTVCVGRFLIDIPEEAQVELRQARIDGFDISAFDEAEESFQKRVADRESEIGAAPDRLGGNKNLESVKENRRWPYRKNFLA